MQSQLICDFKAGILSPQEFAEYTRDLDGIKVAQDVYRLSYTPDVILDPKVVTRCEQLKAYLADSTSVRRAGVKVVQVVPGTGTR